jgi:DNA-binding NtrC family response regulator
VEASHLMSIDAQPVAFPRLVDAGRGPRAESSDPLLARSTVMQQVVDLARNVAATDTPVLIQGEFGVGKTTVAHEIHRRSRRASAPFIHIACGALRDPDAADRLFGASAEGNSADKSRPLGLLQSSEEGTLFLDDLERLSLPLQVRLLDYLQDNSGRAPRGNGSGIGARVIAATTCDLDAAVTQNDFYSGLYYYLNVVHIHIPPLRHRQEDIRVLGERFLAKANSMRGPLADDTPRRLTDEAWQAILACDLPGNAVQLASLIVRAVMLADSAEIGPSLVAAELSAGPQNTADSEAIAVPLVGGLKGMERAIIGEVLRRCRGNKAAAARTLGMHRRTLYRMLR